MHSIPFHILIRPPPPFQGRIVELIVIYMHFSDLFDLYLVSPNPCEEETIKRLDLSCWIFRESEAFIFSDHGLYFAKINGRQAVGRPHNWPAACLCCL